MKGGRGMRKRNASTAERWRNRIVGHSEEDPKGLLAHPLNYRRHPREQMAALAGSLKELGWVRSVIVNRTTGHVIDGHARCEEAIQRGERVQVEWVDLSEDEERKALAVLDPITEMATRDEEALEGLLQQVSTEEEGLQALLEGLLGRSDEGEEGEGVTVREIQVAEVQDRFWISLTGPLPKQLEVLEVLKRAWEQIPGVEVNAGVTSAD